MFKCLGGLDHLLRDARKSQDRGSIFPEPTTGTTSLGAIDNDMEQNGDVIFPASTVVSSACPSCGNLAAGVFCQILDREKSLEHGCQLCPLLLWIASEHVSYQFRPDSGMEIDEVQIMIKEKTGDIFIQSKPNS